MAIFDLKIIGGKIVDGTGGAPYLADLGVKDGKITAIAASLEGDADKTIDAGGHIVTPGWVDIHTHYDGQVSWDEELSPSCYHGVTTAVMGSCGVGFAPVRESDRMKLVRLMEGVEDIPGTALAEGISWDWESFPEYMASLDAMPHTIDFACHLTHDPLRVYVMGDRAIADEPATPADIEAMQALVREGLAAGAVGFSTGRTDNHLSIDGEMTPSSEATEAELKGIASVFSEFEHGVLQAVSDFDIQHGRKRFDKEFDILEGMLDAAPNHEMSISLIQRVKDTSQWKRIIERAEQSTAKGKTIRMQVGSRGIGVLLGLEATFHPFIGFPSFKKIDHLPLAEKVAAMKDPAFRVQLLSEESEKLAGDGSPVPALADIFLQNLNFMAMRLFRLGEDFSYEPSPDESVLALAMAQGTTALAVIYDAMLEDGGKELLYFPIYNYHEGNLNAVHTMLTHPLALPGLSDGGAHVGTICDASMPTFMLSHWTRDRKGDKLTLPRVVQMLAGDTAKFVGMHDRGRLEVGLKADINVIDIDHLKILRPRMVRDLPAGGQRLMQDAVGYKATIVSGDVILENDALTGARPGRLVRVGQ